MFKLRDFCSWWWLKKRMRGSLTEKLATTTPPTSKWYSPVKVESHLCETVQCESATTGLKYSFEFTFDKIESLPSLLFSNKKK